MKFLKIRNQRKQISKADYKNHTSFGTTPSSDEDPTDLD